MCFPRPVPLSLFLQILLPLYIKSWNSLPPPFKITQSKSTLECTLAQSYSLLSRFCLHPNLSILSSLSLAFHFAIKRFLANKSESSTTWLPTENHQLPELVDRRLGIYFFSNISNWNDREQLNAGQVWADYIVTIATCTKPAVNASDVSALLVCMALYPQMTCRHCSKFSVMPKFSPRNISPTKISTSMVVVVSAL